MVDEELDAEYMLLKECIDLTPIDLDMGKHPSIREGIIQKESVELSDLLLNSCFNDACLTRYSESYEYDLYVRIKPNGEVMRVGGRLSPVDLSHFTFMLADSKTQVARTIRKFSKYKPKMIRLVESETHTYWGHNIYGLFFSNDFRTIRDKEEI